MKRGTFIAGVSFEELRQDDVKQLAYFQELYDINNPVVVGNPCLKPERITTYKDPDTSGGAVNLAGTGPKVPGDFPCEGISGFLTVSYRFQ